MAGFGHVHHAEIPVKDLVIAALEAGDIQQRDGRVRLFAINIFTDGKGIFIHLYPENSIVLDVDTPLDSFGGKSAYEVAQEAFARHKSQQQWFSVEKSGPYDCRLFGLYSSQVGPDSRGGDLFENITNFSDDIPEPVSQPQNESRPRPDNTGGLSVNFYLIGGVMAAGLILIIINLKGADKNGKSKK